MDDLKSTRPSCRQLVGDLWLSLSLFSRETTLHGVRRIALANTLWKKTLWILLMALSFAALAFQLTKKFKAYFNTKGALDMDVQYYSSMVFPAVMLCNANLFRISEATKREWNMYSVLQTLYNDTASNETLSNEVNVMRFPQLARIDGAKFLTAAAHQKEDMILHCSWPDGEPCTSDDFRTVITDYGVCYSINDNNRSLNFTGHWSASNASGPFSATSTGVGYGLYLLLNVEDYEAMAGPQRTVGVKVLIYDQNSTPSVSEQGFDVAPGFQTSVGLKKTRIERLSKEEGGQCGYAPLRLFKNENYSRRICALDRKYYAASNQCECLSYDMPNDFSSLPVCNVIQYFTCMLKAMQRAPDIDDADCPQDCNSTEYQQYQSFSLLSPININSLLTEKQRYDMELRYLAAREARSRNDLNEARSDQRLVERLLDVYQELENRLFLPGNSIVDNLMPLLRNITCFVDYIGPLMEQNGFCSEDELDSIVMKPLAKLLVRIAQMLDVSTLPGVVEHGLALIKQLNQSQTMCRSLAEDISIHFVDSSLSAMAPSESSATIPNIDEIAFVVRQQLLVENSKAVIKHLSMNLDASIRDFATATAFIDGHVAYTENITSLNEFNRTQLLREFLINTSQCLTNLTKSVPSAFDMTYYNMKYRGIKRRLFNCSEVAKQCMRMALNFTTLFGKYQELISSYKTNHTAIVEEIRTTCKKLDSLRQIYEFEPTLRSQGVVEYGELYQRLRAFTQRRQTKAKFAKQVLDISSKFYFPESVKDYFDDVSTDVRRLKKAFAEAEAAVQILIKYYSTPRYREILDMAFADSRYKSFDNSAQYRLSSANSCFPHLDEFTANLIDMSDQSAQSYLQHFHQLREHLQKYNGTLRLDEHFHKNNLLALKIYLRDKSVEILKQKESYDFWSLGCDIGGTLGLFLGASLLTFGEIIEYLVGQCAHVFQRRYESKKTRNAYSNQSSYRSSNGLSGVSGVGTTETNFLLHACGSSGSHFNAKSPSWTEQSRTSMLGQASVNDSIASRKPTVIVSTGSWSKPTFTIEV